MNERQINKDSRSSYSAPRVCSEAERELARKTCPPFVELEARAIEMRMEISRLQRQLNEVGVPKKVLNKSFDWIAEFWENGRRQTNFFELYIGLLVLFFFAVVFFVFIAFTPTKYRGKVSDIRRNPAGMAIDLDGPFPRQSMIVWIPADYLKTVMGKNQPPKVGDYVVAHGPISYDNGVREIIIRDHNKIIINSGTATYEAPSL
jgi:hypothetical protein